MAIEEPFMRESRLVLVLDGSWLHSFFSWKTGDKKEIPPGRQVWEAWNGSLLTVRLHHDLGTNHFFTVQLHQPWPPSQNLRLCFQISQKLYQNSLNWSSFVDLSHYGRLVHVNAVIFQGCIGLDISLIRLSLSYTGFWATTILLNYLTICLPSWPILIFCKRNEVSINTAQKLLQ